VIWTSFKKCREFVCSLGKGKYIPVVLKALKIKKPHCLNTKSQNYKDKNCFEGQTRRCDSLAWNHKNDVYFLADANAGEIPEFLL